jgi:phosphotriesterase-related protein
MNTTVDAPPHDERLVELFVETALGPVASSDLGVVLAHEHIAVLSDGVVAQFPRVYDRDAAHAIAVEKLRRAAAVGVGTIVDLTVLGLGRDIELQRSVAADCGLHVVLATGAYTFDVLPPFFARRDVDVLPAQFAADITEGIGGTVSRAAVLKCATDAPGVTPDVDKVLRACARAHLATGRPISTHTNVANHGGLLQLDVFRQEGVDLSSVVIGHCGDSDDLGYLSEVAASGCMLGMDRFGFDSLLPLEQRVATVVALWERGLGDQLLLSHDCVCDIDWFPRRAATLPNDVAYIHREVLPRLRAAGLGDGEIHTMLVQTPRRMLEGTRR